jgi:hypothetical protein
MVCVLAAGTPGTILSASALDAAVATLECRIWLRASLYEGTNKLGRLRTTYNPKVRVESHLVSPMNDSLPCI